MSEPGLQVVDNSLSLLMLGSLTVVVTCPIHHQLVQVVVPSVRVAKGISQKTDSSASSGAGRPWFAGEPRASLGRVRERQQVTRRAGLCEQLNSALNLNIITRSASQLHLSSEVVPCQLPAELPRYQAPGVSPH